MKPDLCLCLTKRILQRSTSRFIDDAIDIFFDEGFDISACATQQSQLDKRSHPEPQILEQPFTTTRQAMGLPKMCSPGAAAFLTSFVGEIEQSGFISGAIKGYRVKGQSSRQPNVSNT